MWFLLLIFLLLFAAAGLFYLVTRFRKFKFIHNVSRGSSKRTWLFACIPVLLLVCLFFVSPFPMLVVIMHLILFWALSDLIGYYIRKARKKEFRCYYQGLFAIAFTTLYLCIGWHFAHHVYQTEYIFKTQKDLGAESVRLVLIADSHLGEMMSAEAFTQQIERIQSTSPDIVVIAGDFVDDDTSKAELIAACEALGDLDTTYGIYYVFGNHDKGYYNSRDFSEDDLRIALEENQVTILEDEALLLNDSIYLIGRQDRSEDTRAEISDLVAALDTSKYMIVLNHQPNDYDKEVAANVDLVLSGHTHGGHIFPVGVIGFLLGANDKVYGTEHRGNTDFVVTSGISGWGIPFKTGAISEYVVIDISNES